MFEKTFEVRRKANRNKSQMKFFFYRDMLTPIIRLQMQQCKVRFSNLDNSGKCIIRKTCIVFDLKRNVG